MAQEPISYSPFSKTGSKENFIDPGRKRWVWITYILLLSGMLPVWPVRGIWFGLPAWALLAVFMSLIVSVFTAYVILKVWQEPGDDNP